MIVSCVVSWACVVDILVGDEANTLCFSRQTEETRNDSVDCCCWALAVVVDLRRKTLLALARA